MSLSVVFLQLRPCFLFFYAGLVVSLVFFCVCTSVTVMITHKSVLVLFLFANIEGNCRLFKIKCNSSFSFILENWKNLHSCKISPVCLYTVGLQSTRLGMYIEDRVNKYLKRQNHPEAGEVFVRVVASSDKTVEVKPGMKTRWEHHWQEERRMGWQCFQNEILI